MIELSKVKYCIDMDSELDVKEDKRIVIKEKYVLDLDFTRNEDKTEIEVKYEDYDHTTSRIYLFEKILINWLLEEKKYKKVTMSKDYPNMNLVDIKKEYTSRLDFPIDNVVSGDYCVNCIKRKECKELNECIMGMNKQEDIKNDAQLFNTYILMSNRRKALLKVEEQLKELLYDKIVKNNNKLEIKEMGIELSKNQIEKDVVDFGEAQANGLITASTVSFKLKEVKEMLKKDGILRGKIHLKKEKFREELDVNNIKGK